MAASLPNPSFAPTINRLPQHLRSKALRLFSANANAPGAAKLQTKGRSRGDSSRGLARAGGVQTIEAVVTGPLAASVGLHGSGTVNTGGGTPATLAFVSGDGLKAVTYAAPGQKVLTVTVSPWGAVGEAVITV
jgi:hypothetical protein